jgi:hypothetical protein
MPSPHGASSRLLDADLEPRRHSSFLTIAVPGIAAVLAVGAIVWSGSLRDRVRQQDAAMITLQEQNRKLADTLAQMNTEQNASSALNSGSSPADAAAESAGDGSQKTTAPPTQQPPAENPADAQSEPQSAGESSAAPRSPARKENRQGVATPPPVQTSSQGRHSRYRQPVEAGYTPEIVPPYPTNFRPENAAPNPAASQPVPNAGTYHPPFPVTGTAQPAAASAATPSRPQTTAPQPSRTPAPTSYLATSNGQYASLLAQNIETVEALQRHSQVALREFHAQAGTLTRVTPALGVSVEQPDPGHGTYALVVDGSGGRYQLRGQVNRPAVFTDNATHRDYELVVLRIAGQQVYGYVRAAR